MTLFANFLGGLCISYLVQYNLYLKIIREAMQMYLRQALVSPTRRMNPDNSNQTLMRSRCVLLLVFAVNTMVNCLIITMVHPAIHRSNNTPNDVFVLPLQSGIQLTRRVRSSWLLLSLSALGLSSDEFLITHSTSRLS